MKRDNGKEVGVKVFCRFRPIGISKSLKESNKHNFEILNGKSVALACKTSPQDHLFHLDMIFNASVKQNEMFEFVGKPIVHDVLFGYNGTIFAYGQTGSGKTHALFGDMTSQQSHDRGIIPRSCEMIFNHIEESSDIQEAMIKCSFIEIYKEKLQDLLEPKSKLKIRENTDKSIYIEGVHEEYVSCFDDVYELLQIGFRNRMVACTLMNQQSSRSHCVLTLTIKQTLRGGIIKLSKVNFADLAGSERVSKSGASGGTLDEAKSINLSLSALGNVISALTAKGTKHIPYRNSKLTFLLQDALGGNTKTSLITTCSSDKYNYEETVSTLRFARRAKQMKNNVTVNKQLSVKELKIVIEVYKQQVSAAHSTIARLQKIILLMRSSEYNAETSGPQIDLYLKELHTIQQTLPGAVSTTSSSNSHCISKKHRSHQSKSKSPPSQRRISTPKHSLKLLEQRHNAMVPIKDADTTEEIEDNDDHTESIESTPSSSIEFATRGPERDTIKIINTLHTDIESKELALQALREEMGFIKAEMYKQRQQLEKKEEESKERELKEVSTSNNKPNKENKEDVESELEDNEMNMRLQHTIEEQAHFINELMTEKEEMQRDREQLLVWNQEMQKRLDVANNISTESVCMTEEEISQVLEPLDKQQMCDKLEEQLGALRTIMNTSSSTRSSSDSVLSELEVVNDIKDNMETKSDDGEVIIRGLAEARRILNMGQHKLRAQQTAQIISKLQQQLSTLAQMGTEDAKELTAACLTTICCVLDNSLSTEAQLPGVEEIQEMRRTKTLSQIELDEIDGLKRENQQLIRKLADMKTTWIAHLDMLMGPNPMETNISTADTDVALTPTQSPKKFAFKTNSKSSKVVKPVVLAKLHGSSIIRKKAGGRKYGWKHVIGYLSGALLQYFGQVAILRGNLLMCNRRVSLLDFTINPGDWKKVFIVLTKTELVAYRSELHAETDSKSPLFKCKLRSVVSLLKIEEVLSAMAIQSNSPTTNGSEDSSSPVNKYEAMFILTSTQEKYILKAEGEENRETWIDNIEQALSAIDS